VISEETLYNCVWVFLASLWTAPFVQGYIEAVSRFGFTGLHVGDFIIVAVWLCGVVGLWVLKKLIDRLDQVGE